MIGSDLYTPIPGRIRRPRRRIPVRSIASCVGVLVVGGAAMIVMGDGGDEGEPFAVGTITTAAAPVMSEAAAPKAPTETASAVTVPPPTGDAAASQQIQIENGVTVVRGMVPGGSTPTTLRIPDPVEPKQTVRAPDPQLLEATSSGALPRIGRDGRRPASVYAAAPVATEGKPRIAIVVGGMGLDQVATAQAKLQLPAGVTFGFAPYGDNLAEQAAAVRAAGHEVVLQLPMEDFGQNDRSFSHMLKTNDGDNADRLRWLMTRFPGYAGVANYLGGRLLADEGSLRPVLQDVAARGLYFVDDGTSTRSLALPISHDLDLPAAKADVVIDARADPASVMAALTRLENLARERGFAFGAATGLPATNTMIGRFLADAVKRGIVIVPVSQAVGVTTAARAGRASGEAKR